MIELGSASDDDAVLAFLQAEIDSPKWGRHYRAAMRARGLERARLIDAADLSDAQANHDRMSLLGDVRGFGRGIGLFRGFPLDVEWKQVIVEPPDFQRLKYISGDADWLDLSGGTRLVQEGARNLEIDSNIAASVRRTQRGIEQGRCAAALILVENGRDELVIVEGHTRATAYVSISDRSFPAFVGTSPLMMQWVFI
jgi:hypothetical protein